MSNNISQPFKHQVNQNLHHEVVDGSKLEYCDKEQ